MNEIMQTIFGLAGGLAMFLFGMNMMSEGLQKAAGEKMKNILALLTKNPILGVLAGALVTAVLQSSSATTVMVIGFVSAGLMKLPQAISVILGANIGTTMTAQLLAFKISDYIWLIVFVGFMIFFLAKKNEKVKNVGQTIFAFGILFVGIETMGAVMKPLASSPVFTDMIGKVSDIPVLGVFTGALMTLVVQSSSATIAVLQNFASQAGPDGVSSVIGLTGAIPILLGDNIGTTITALIASIGQSKNAKRTAVAHSVFNITGSIIFVFLIPWFAKFVEWISPKGAELDIISRQIANAHTTFNVVCTLLWLPFIGVLVKIVKFIVRGEDKANADRKSKFIDYNIVGQPAFAIKMVTREMEDIAEEVKKVLSQIPKAIIKEDPKVLAKVRTSCENLIERNNEVLQYLATLFSAGSLTENQAAYASDMLVVMENLDHISHRCLELNSYGMEKVTKKAKFSEEAEEELKKDIATVIKMYHAVIQYMKGEIDNPVKEFNANKDKLVKLRNKARKNNAKRMQQKSCQKVSGELFNQAMFSLERITHDCFNMLENDISQFGLEED